MTTTLLWLNDIACKDMPLDAFFIEAGHSIDQETLNTCRSCPVRLECLAHGYDYGSGYRGGLSPGQRRAMELPEAIEYVKTDKPRPTRNKRN